MRNQPTVVFFGQENIVDQLWEAYHQALRRFVVHAGAVEQTKMQCCFALKPVMRKIQEDSKKN